MGLGDVLVGNTVEREPLDLAEHRVAHRLDHRRDVADAVVVQRAAGEEFERRRREFARERLQDLRKGLAKLRVGGEDGDGLVGGELAALDAGVLGGEPDVFGLDGAGERLSEDGWRGAVGDLARQLGLHLGGRGLAERNEVA